MDRIQGCLNLLKSCRKGIYIMCMSRGDYLITYKKIFSEIHEQEGYEAFSHMTLRLKAHTNLVISQLKKK